ncbi:PAS domain-containing sensor histidine kinase [Rhodobacteraceae bacterium CCMM004]|nr:PAS domain-containing sensor histidine kinase [Rhodobacteraceae bacterium CCMM004]
MSKHDPTPEAAAHAGFSDHAWGEVLRAVDDTYSALIRNQSELEARNRELEELRAVMASLLASSTDVHVVIGRSGTVVELSQSVLDLTGRPRKAVVGKPAAGLFADPERFDAALERVIFDRAPTTLELSLAAADGPQPLDVSLSPRLDDRMRSAGAVLSGRPVGELRRAFADLEESHAQLKQAQTQLVHNEKLASLGRLLAGVAHELNNPISFVYANAHALERYAGKFETYFERVAAGADRPELVRLREELKLDRELRNLRHAIDGARDGAARVRDIVEDLRRLSSDGTGEVVEFDLAEAGRIGASWVQRGTKQGVDLVFDLPGEVMARGRPGHVQQVIMNLVQNAVDAVAERADAQVRLSAGVADGAAWLEVRDNGPGIPADVAAHIFDPFFTTKPVGQGTGLGLAISHKIAEEHGGDLRLVGGGAGTCFRLDLPRGGGAR